MSRGLSSSWAVLGGVGVGPALAAEADELLRAVSSVRGVAGVDNQLEIHERAGGVSSLRGEVNAAASGGRR